tara:strand:- start:171 stop:698 length:528 start_codon:yes stop_codon:yes gene_type:complete
MKNFKELEGFPYYYACDDGNIYSKKGIGSKKDSYNNNYKKLSSAPGSSGYLQVCIKNESGKYLSRMVHRLIAKAFVGNLVNGMTVSHLDGNKVNNSPKNLTIESQRDNLKRKINHGTHDIGTNNSRALINESQLLKIRKMLKSKKYTHKQIGKLFGVSGSFITKINCGYRYNMPT